MTRRGRAARGIPRIPTPRMARAVASPQAQVDARRGERPQGQVAAALAEARALVAPQHNAPQTRKRRVQSMTMNFRLVQPYAWTALGTSQIANFANPTTRPRAPQSVQKRP